MITKEQLYEYVKAKIEQPSKLLISKINTLVGEDIISYNDIINNKCDCAIFTNICDYGHDGDLSWVVDSIYKDARTKSIENINTIDIKFESITLGEDYEDIFIFDLDTNFNAKSFWIKDNKYLNLVKNIKIKEKGYLLYIYKEKLILKSGLYSSLYYLISKELDNIDNVDLDKFNKSKSEEEKLDYIYKEFIDKSKIKKYLKNYQNKIEEYTINIKELDELNLNYYFIQKEFKNYCNSKNVKLLKTIKIINENIFNEITIEEIFQDYNLSMRKYNEIRGLLEKYFHGYKIIDKKKYYEILNKEI